jgi:two-component system, OmpR family, sensor kinase
MIPLGPRGIRARLILAVAPILVVALIAIVVVFNLLLRHSLGGSAADLARSRAAAALATIQARNGHLRVVEAPGDESIDAEVWVFEGARVVAAPPPQGPELTEAVRELASSTRAADQSRAGAHIAVVPIERNGRRLGSVVAGVSLEPYRETAWIALVASGVLASILLLMLGLTARWTLRRALTPVREMTREAERYSELAPRRRFLEGEPYDELTELAATLDRLLDRLAAALRHEQQFSAELSHELRHPLARISAEAELALRRERSPEHYREALAAISRNAAHMRRTVDALFDAARLEAEAPRGSSAVRDVAERAVEDVRVGGEERALEVDVEVPGSLHVGVDAAYAERVLAPLLANAYRYARSSIRVTASRADGGVVIAVRDDGPGVAPDDVERIFLPGERGENAPGDGAGLGLALARRLARAADGDIWCVPTPNDGAVFEARLPIA